MPFLDLTQLDLSASKAHEAAMSAQRRVGRLADTVVALNEQVEDLDGVCAAIQRALDSLLEERHATEAESLRFQAELRAVESEAAELLSNALTSRLTADDERLRRRPGGPPHGAATTARSAFQAPALRPLADARP